MQFESPSLFNRRLFIRTTAAAGLLTSFGGILPGYAQAVRRTELSGTDFDLTIAEEQLRIGGRRAKGITINGVMPGPLIRLREGDDVTIRVHNQLDESTSIHWHGLILPFRMDGVPGVSYAGIPAGERFTYRFPVRQSGTYWYHSHSGLQEQLGHAGPMIIEPRGGDPVVYDREYVVLLSDWSSMNPYKLLAKLKKESNYSNYQRRTLGDFFQAVASKGLGPTLADRARWGAMRMDPTDIADITGHYYTYLMNGLAPDDNWTGLFHLGERVRLRFINAGAGTFFDVRIPGLPMTVVAADGQNVKPVTVDEFRIAIAETYDVIVEPKADRAYTLFAESMDRSGYARGTLAPRDGMTAAVPPQRKRPVLTMADMGMTPMAMAAMGDMDKLEGQPMPGMEMPNAAEMPDADAIPVEPDPGGTEAMLILPDGRHGPDHHGAGAATVAMMPTSRLGEPGIGLEDMPWRVLVYNDLESLHPQPDRRKPDREIELHATGNMERYMWSFDGKKLSEVTGPIPFYLGERLRLTLVNDTMMAHPMHLHGMFVELDNGHGVHRPNKHTIGLKPGEKISLDITVDAPGVWAFHCHILYHMDMGMFRIVAVAPKGSEVVS